MLLEYLVGKDKAEKVLLELADYSCSCNELNNNLSFISVIIDGNSEKEAKKASDLNEKILPFKPTVLTNSSAEYFNVKLYPLVNGFERKLRKLLYAASALQNDDANLIIDLEKKDFGEIFSILFKDVDYQKNIKSFVNGGKDPGWNGFSSELLEYLKTAKEDLLWDRLLPGQVPTLRKDFFEIQRKRNDIMHAHNITKKEFNESQRLFKKVNAEIDEAINGLSEGKFTPPENYQYELTEALRIYDGSYTIADVQPGL